MKVTPLKIFLESNSQQMLADAVGLTQGAISKMVRVNRNINVAEHEDGSIELREERIIKSSSEVTGSPTAA